MHGHLFSVCSFCHHLLRAGCNAQGIFHRHQVMAYWKSSRPGLDLQDAEGKGFILDRIK